MHKHITYTHTVDAQRWDIMVVNVKYMSRRAVGVEWQSVYTLDHNNEDEA